MKNLFVLMLAVAGLSIASCGVFVEEEVQEETSTDVDTLEVPVEIPTDTVVSDTCEDTVLLSI